MQTDDLTRTRQSYGWTHDKYTMSNIKARIQAELRGDIHCRRLFLFVKNKAKPTRTALATSYLGTDFHYESRLRPQRDFGATWLGGSISFAAADP